MGLASAWLWVQVPASKRINKKKKGRKKKKTNVHLQVYINNGRNLIKIFS